MAIPNLTTITGASVSGLTSPTFTFSADSPPDTNQKQWIVSALGGTQAGVVVHSLAAPFFINFQRPKVFKALGRLNPTTGALSSVPRNRHVIRTVKGVLPLANQAYENFIIRTEMEIPAGADMADPNSIRAALSAHFGVLFNTAVAAGISDTAINGVL